ncbi:kinase-like domain-containing protein [Schizothecium vesticola]|uniref:Kinase-like domain-containing protein n=1 Tax=Schizothecium vesticola TaxID=314040 RepID=A0AA40ER04_9PEZI|nr:kinase-like domain-containing protein [Schizothecium vesticola]
MPSSAQPEAAMEPNLLEHGETTNCCTVLLQEVEIYEALRQHPHPNIARYHGCYVGENGGFRGIYLQRYSATLKQRKPAVSEKEKRRLVRGIRDCVAHLHSLGLVHNDLNPSNVMVEGDVAVIIDFDSCRREGAAMGVKGPTPGWGEFTGYATLESDVRNLDQMERYLLG